jgi:hypothetical protein
MTHTDWSWEVNVKVKLNIQVPISYYQILPTGALKLIGTDDGSASNEFDLTTAKNASLRIVAAFQLPTIGSTNVQGMQLMFETIDKGGDTTRITKATDTSTAYSSEFTSETPVVVDANYDVLEGAEIADRTKWAPQTVKEATFIDMYNRDTTAGFTYAGDDKWYYTVMELKKADSQQFRLASIFLRLDNGSTPELYNSNISLVHVKELKPPTLR